MITSMEEFRAYIKQELGAPVVCVEVSNDQLNNAINKAYKYFSRYMYGEGLYEDFIKLQVTSGTSAYSLSGIEDAMDIDFSSCCNLNALFTPANLFTQPYISHSNYNSFGSSLNGNYGYNATGGLELAEWDIAMGYLKDWKERFCKTYRVDYRQGPGILQLVPTPMTSGTALIRVYKKESAMDLYNHIFFQELACAFARIQWGNNIGKYSITLPGGGTMNGAEILQFGIAERDRILERLETEGEPNDFYVA